MTTRLYSGEQRIDALDPRDRGLAYGDGVFETLLVHRGEPVWWPAHLERLARGCGILGIRLPDPGFLRIEVDALGGAIPIIGDLWDFLFRAHTRNLALLQARTSDGPVKSRPSDTLIVLAAALVLLASLAAPLVVLVALVKWIRG